MKIEQEAGFSLVEVVMSLIIVCMVIEMMLTSFIYVKRQYISDRYKEEAVRYGQEMLQYAREKMSQDGQVNREDLEDYLKNRPEGMKAYTYSFLWIPFSYHTHIVQTEEIPSAKACSTASHFDWKSVQDAIASESLYLKTMKQKNKEVTQGEEIYWLIGMVGKKQGEGVYEEIQYFVTYQ